MAAKRHRLAQRRKVMGLSQDALAGLLDVERRHHGLCLLKMGNAYQATGDRQAAIGHLQESLAIFGQLRLGHCVARAREALSICQDNQHAASG